MTYVYRVTVINWPSWCPMSPGQGEAGRGDTPDTNDATGAHQ